MEWGILLGVLAAAVIFAVWRSRETEEEPFTKKSGKIGAISDNPASKKASEAVHNGPIAAILNELGKDFILLNGISVHGWTKHKAKIDYLLITKQGITVFKNVVEPANSVTATQKEWILETKEGKKKIKNPVNMNNYAISILRNIFKKKIGEIYPKIDFSSVVLFDDSVKINSSRQQNKNAIVIKKSRLNDLLETISQKPEKLTKSEMLAIKEAVE